MQLLVFYITFPDQQAAEDICKTCIQERLAACYNILPIQSGYVWQNTFCAEQEIAAYLKTADHLESELEQRIRTLHPYETPCIMRWAASANAEYLDWIMNSVKPQEQ